MPKGCSPMSTITAKIQIFPDTVQAELLQNTYSAYTDACNWVSGIIFDTKNLNQMVSSPKGELFIIDVCINGELPCCCRTTVKLSLFKNALVIKILQYFYKYFNISIKKTKSLAKETYVRYNIKRTI